MHTNLTYNLKRHSSFLHLCHRSSFQMNQSLGFKYSIKFNLKMSSSDDVELKVRNGSFGYNGASTSQKSPEYIRHATEMSQAQIEKLKELQGQCKIHHFQLLRINYPKAIFFAFLMISSIVGLLLLKYYKKLRAFLFYSRLDSSEIDQATHIFISGSDQNQSICTILDNVYDGRNRKIFTFKHLRYEYIDRECCPLGMRYAESINEYDEAFLRSGLQKDQVRRRQAFYGKNEHLVQVPNYFEYLFDTMTQPFFIFQYFVSIVYILQNVAIFGILMIAFGYITTSINYILLYRSYQTIKETAEKQFDVTVLRNGQIQTIYNVDLVCGDLYVPHGEIPCDSILMAGELFIDQASLTGEAVPIPKFKLTDPSEIEQKNHWLFEGSMVKTKKEGSLAMVVNVGFGSRRGRIIRKILTKKPKQPQFFKKMIYFLLEVLVVSLILYGATVQKMFGLNIQKIMIFFRFLDFITYSFPAPLPIFFNLAYSFCLIRLRRDGILGTQSQKTIQSSRLKTICFDKTGTLTHSGMRVANVFSIPNSNTISDITQNLNAYPLIADIFGCCNSVEMINDNYDGDEIDLKMFHHVKASITQKSNSLPNVIRCIKVEDRLHEVIRINEYQSKFQSMSVLFRHRQTNRYFVVAKGSPQMIHTYSQAKIKDYDAFIKKMSLEGFRSIAFAFREINEREVASYIKADRQFYLKSINILGVVTFVNLLKEDAQSTIKTLTQCDINTKIITGDNIFLGVQTALMTGMIPNNMKVIVLQGGKFRGDSVDITELERLESGQITQKQRRIDTFAFEHNKNVAYAIDNDYIQNNPESFLHNRVKVFARITPQNKALIVRKHKQMIANKIKARAFWKGIFGESSVKVGMVGDGANDLIAIKDADVGIGISSSDAVYSASFAIQDLSQIVEIICQAKSTERQIVDMTQYFMVICFLSIISTIILTVDVTYLSSMQQIYKNFVTTLLMTLFFALSRPAKQLSKYLPNSNFMGRENHLIFWSSAILLSAGLVTGYFYYYNSSDFIANPKQYATFQDGWNSICKSTTVNFIIEILQFTLLPIFIFRSSPWKEPIYKNIPLLVLIIINLCLILPIYFFTANLSFLDLSPIGRSYAAVILVITAVACLLCGIVNLIIEKSHMHQDLAHNDQMEAQISEDQGTCQ